MPIYEWVCKDCKLIWDRECAMGKAPDRTRCPDCKKLSERHFEGQNIGVAFGLDADFHTVRARAQKIEEKGFDKTAADRFLKNHIQHSKDAMNDERYRYKGVNIDYQKLARDGKFNKVSESEARKRREEQKRMTEDAYNRANNMGARDHMGNKLDISKPKKQN